MAEIHCASDPVSLYAAGAQGQRLLPLLNALFAKRLYKEEKTTHTICMLQFPFLPHKMLCCVDSGPYNVVKNYISAVGTPAQIAISKQHQSWKVVFVVTKVHAAVCLVSNQTTPY